MPKVILFGGTGLLGKELVKVLHSSKYDLVFPSRVDLDLSKESEVINFLKSIGTFDFLINCSGYNFVDKAETSPLEQKKCYYLNSDIPKLLGSLSYDLNKSAQVVQFSSDYVFDGLKSSEYTEDDIKNPLSVYGHSKSLGEDLLLEANPNSIIFRTSWLFGPGKDNFLSRVFLKVSNNEELSIISDQVGKPTYTVDLARAVVDNLAGISSGIYHLSNETIYSWYDFAKFGLGLSKNEFKIKPISSLELNLPAKRPSYSALKNTKLDLLRPGEEAIIEYVNSIL